jgi:hypothetical protein
MPTKAEICRRHAVSSEHYNKTFKKLFGVGYDHDSNFVSNVFLEKFLETLLTERVKNSARCVNAGNCPQELKLGRQYKNRKD